MASDIHDWKITFVETGADVEHRPAPEGRRDASCGDEPEFLANYSDGLSNLPLPAHLEHFRAHDAVASFVSVKPNLSYHVVSTEPDGLRHQHRRDSADADPDQRRILRRSAARSSTTSARARSWSSSRSSGWCATGRLAAYEYDGFWMSMDTFKDRQQLEDIYTRGNAPGRSGTATSSPPAPGTSRRRRVACHRGAATARLSDACAEPAPEVGRPRCGSCASARTRTTSKSAAAACCSSLDRAPQGGRDWVVFSAPGEREREARRGAALFLKRAARKRVADQPVPGRVLPLRAATSRTVFDRSSARRRRIWS